MIELLVIAICGYLWHLGGQSHKWCRVMVGGVIGLYKSLTLWSVYPMFYWLLLWILTSLFSYGLTSPVHKLWVRIYGKGGDGDYMPVEIATRATCGFFWSLASLVFVVITGQWHFFSAYVLCCTLFVSIFGIEKHVGISECGTGGTVAFSIFV